MIKPRVRWPFLLLLAAAVLIVPIAVLAGLSEWSKRSATARQSKCADTVSKYVQVKPVVPGKITAITPYYNGSRKECLVQISSVTLVDGGESLSDEVIDPKTDVVIATRISERGQRHMRDNTIVTGAPVSLQNEAGAEAWFVGLMR